MSMAMSRGVGALELLVGHQAGLPLGEIAASLDIAKSAAHRTLSELADLGYVRQEGEQGNYVLTMRIVSMAQRHLAQIPLVELARPFLRHLAGLSGEMSRLSIVDGNALVWVAKEEGQRSALRFDPDAGRQVKLSCSASGPAWLSTMPEDRAMELVEQQGFADSDDAYGIDAPRNAQEFREILDRTRERGYGHAEDTFEIGVAAIAVPIVPVSGSEAAAVINLCGPSARLTTEKCLRFLPDLREAAAELATLFESGASGDPDGPRRFREYA